MTIFNNQHYPRTPTSEEIIELRKRCDVWGTQLYTLRCCACKDLLPQVRTVLASLSALEHSSLGPPLSDLATMLGSLGLAIRCPHSGRPSILAAPTNEHTAAPGMIPLVFFSNGIDGQPIVSAPAGSTDASHIELIVQDRMNRSFDLKLSVSRRLSLGVNYSAV